MKQILFTKKNTAEFLEVENRPISSNQIKVKTAISSISCGTERAINSYNVPKTEKGR